MKKIFMILGICMTVMLTAYAAQMTLEQGLRSDEDYVREKVLKRLMEEKPDSKMDLPISALRMPLYDSDSSVRINAISVLRHRGIKDFNKDLIILMKEAVATVRMAACQALGDLGTKQEATLPLWRSLNDADTDVRHAAIDAIDHLHKTKLGFYYDQSPGKYRLQAQMALKEYLKIDKTEAKSHANKIYGKVEHQ
jgi:hypothetical protein